MPPPKFLFEMLCCRPPNFVNKSRIFSPVTECAAQIEYQNFRKNLQSRWRSMRPPPLLTPMSTTLPAQSALLRARRRAPAPSSTSTSMRIIEGIPAVKPLTETVHGLGIDSQINLNDYRISETRGTPPNFDELFASMTLPQNVKRNSRVFHTGQRRSLTHS